MAVSKEGLDLMAAAAMAFTAEDVARCERVADDLEDRIDDEGPDIALFEEMQAWRLMAEKIREAMRDRLDRLERLV